MSILSTICKAKRYIKTDNGYQLFSEWQKASEVEFNNGSDAETTLGAINGITSSLNTNNDNYALSAAGGYNLQSQVTKLNTNLTNGLNSKENTNAFKKYCPTFGTTYSSVISDAICVDTSSADGAPNKVCYVANNGATSNMPGNCFFGIREVYYYNQQEIWVKITGVNTENHISTWYNRYIGTAWLGWHEQITFDKNKWTGNISRININATVGSSDKIYDSENWLVFGTGNGITSRSKDNINVYLPVSGSAFQQLSSKKVKDNIKDLTEDEAQKILNVRTVSFDYIEKVGGEKNQRGVIAEEIEKLIPSCVYHDGDYPSVDYTKLIPYLIKIVQMQQKEIDELKQFCNQ